jgi:hypothetical protein
MIRMLADEIRFTSVLCKCCNLLNILIIFLINETVRLVAAECNSFQLLISEGVFRFLFVALSLWSLPDVGVPFYIAEICS